MEGEGKEKGGEVGKRKRWKRRNGSGPDQVWKEIDGPARAYGVDSLTRDSLAVTEWASINYLTYLLTNGDKHITVHIQIE